MTQSGFLASHEVGIGWFQAFFVASSQQEAGRAGRSSCDTLNTVLSGFASPEGPETLGVVLGEARSSVRSGLVLCGSVLLRSFAAYRQEQHEVVLALVVLVLVM